MRVSQTNLVCILVSYENISGDRQDIRGPVLTTA
jgi:hypothetical protein